MKIRTIALAALAVATLGAGQFAALGSAHAVGTANGGVWKTTSMNTSEAGLLLPAVQRFGTDTEQAGAWLPAVQKGGCGAC